MFSSVDLWFARRLLSLVGGMMLVCLSAYFVWKGKLDMALWLMGGAIYIRMA